MLTYEEFHQHLVDNFDMQDFKDSIGPGYSDEMLLYPLFYRQMVLRRIGDFNRLWDISEFKEFPVGSILHLVDDNFLMNKPVVFVPDVNGWSMTRDPYRKYIMHISDTPNENWAKNLEKFVLPQQGVTITLLNFRKRYQSYIRTCNDKKDLPGAARTQVQTVMCYDSLYRARIFGLLRSVRRFNYIFGNLLNNIANYPDRMHFIPIPVGDKQFDRNMFLKSFKLHVRATIRYPEDNWYLFCMHLLGFVHGDKTPSIFECIPKNMWDKIHFVLYSKTKVLTLRLDHLKEFNGPNDVIMIRLIKQLNSLAESGTIVTERDFSDVPANIDTVEDKTLPDELLPPDAPFEEKINVTISKSEQKPDVAPAEPEPTKPDTEPDKEEPIQPSEQEVPAVKSPIVHTWGFTPTGKTTSKKEVEPEEVPTEQADPKKEEASKKEEPKKEEPIPTSKPKLEKPLPKEVLKTIEQHLESEKELKVDGLTVDNKWLDVQPKKEQLNAPEFKEPVTKQEQIAFNNALVDQLDKTTMETIQANDQLTAAQRNRAITLGKAYKSIKVGDQTIEQVIRSTPDDSVSENSLDFLKDDVADESMLKSSVETFEHDYMKKMFKRDLLAELVSFNKVGMFLKDVQVTDTSDNLNDTETCVAKYEDINHKEHTIRFVLPKVDERGFCRVNGTLKVLKKQRVPNPICKVSRTRVTLNSDYNKYLVERNTSVAHSFVSYVDRIIKASEGQMKGTLGSHSYVDRTLPYEYTTVASKYSKIEINPEDKSTPWILFFEPAMFADITTNKFIFSKEMQLLAKDTANTERGIIVGVSQDKEIAMLKLDGSMVVRDMKDDHVVETTTFIDFLCDKVQVTLNGLSEWTDFKLLNKSVPTIFALCYRFGLSHMLNYTKTPYQVYNKGQRFPRRMSDVVIRFADKTLVIPRCPLVSSMLFAGLNNYDLKEVEMEQMDSKDIYYELIQSKKISVHNLKGIDNFFDYFVDPITADVLHQMREPIDPKDLLIRATQLLTTEDHKPVASSTNFRFRSYERINSAVYKVLSRAHATYRYKALGASNKFSIADYEIKQLVVQDQLMENVDLINPINDIKYQHEYSHAGFGGRQSIDTFMIDDRQFPDDGTGIVSEATVDSSKTAYAGSMTMDPTIMNMRGMTVVKGVNDLAPTQILSPTSVLVPCVTQDDGKRTNFVNIHLSHYVPTAQMDQYRVKTSFEKVVAHRTRPPFAYAAEEDGVIDLIDTEAKVLRVKYKSGTITAVNFGDEYTNNGGGGFYCTQNIVINNFKQGDKVKKGDIIIYNEKFFTPDPYSKQVEWNFGIEANVACIDNNNTLDDGNAISASLANKLRFNPVHVRDVVIKKTTTIHRYAAVGTTVLNTDPLMIFDQSEMDDSMFGKLDDQAVDLLAKLNRQTPKAKFSGKIVKIDVFYKCDPSEMASGLKGIVNLIRKEKAAKAKAASDKASNIDSFKTDTQIKYTDRIGTTDLDDETVIIRFYIQQDMEMDMGSKIEFGGPFKSVNAHQVENGWLTEDGSITVDALFSSLGISARIANSPLVTGIAARVMEKVEQDILDLYFKK